jgi:hypothetical protein
MRSAALVFALVLCAPVAAAQAPPPAQAAYGERRALLETDARCRLFEPPLRAALEAGAWQARGALTRAGWSNARIAELDAAAARAARGRACDDPRTQAAAARARAGFSGWARLPSLEFRGSQRSWIARRIPDPEGWTLVQGIDAPRDAAFGALSRDGRIRPTLSLALSDRIAPPPSAELVVRDVRRARESLFEVPGRSTDGLLAGAPSPATARRFYASERRIEIGRRGARRLFFVFADDALNAMALLDPREAAEIRLGDGARVLVEIGDLAAARAFLAAR